MALIPHAPEALWGRVVPSSLQVRLPEIRREVSFDDGSKQVWERWDNYIFAESHSLDVTDAERQEVLDFYEQVRFSWFRYSRSDIGSVFARFMTQPGDLSLRDTVGEYWSMPVMLEFWKKGRKNYWEGDRRVKRILAFGVDQVAEDYDLLETYPMQWKPVYVSTATGYFQYVEMVEGDYWLENFHADSDFYGLEFDLNEVEDAAHLLFITEVNRVDGNESVMGIEGKGQRGAPNVFRVESEHNGRIGIALTKKRDNVIIDGKIVSSSSSVSNFDLNLDATVRLFASDDYPAGAPSGLKYESYSRSFAVELWRSMSGEELEGLVKGLSNNVYAGLLRRRV